MHSVPVHEMIECRDCGAVLPRDDRHCWLCGWANTYHALGQPPPPKSTERRPAGAEDYFLQITAVLAIGTIALLVVVTAISEPGAALVIGIFALPAVIATMVATARGRRSGRPLSLTEKAGWFLGSLLVTVGAMVVLWVAAVAALFLICIYAISGMGG